MTIEQPEMEDFKNEDGEMNFEAYFRAIEEVRLRRVKLNTMKSIERNYDLVPESFEALPIDIQSVILKMNSVIEELESTLEDNESSLQSWFEAYPL